MGFLDPRKDDDEDQALPGASGISLDLDLKRCPACRRELPPWQERCPDCGEVGVHASQVKAAGFPLPGLAALEPDAADDDGDVPEGEDGDDDEDGRA